MADDASIRVLAEPNILLPNQGFIDMYNMPNKWLQIHSSRHRTTQASSIFVLLSAFVICIQLMLHGLQDPNKTKKVAKNVCQATELGLQYQPFDIHCSWELVSVLNQTTDGPWENRDFEMDGTPQPLEKNETFTTVRRSHPLVTVKKPELLRLEYLENFQLSSIKDNEWLQIILLQSTQTLNRDQSLRDMQKISMLKQRGLHLFKFYSEPAVPNLFCYTDQYNVRQYLHGSAFDVLRINTTK